MAARKASARWRGPLQEGDGTMRLGGGAYEGPYSFSSRFEEGEGTNPEELIAAAHAGCFSMFLANVLAQAGHEATSVKSSARVAIDAEKGITRSDLSTEVSVEGLDVAEFQKHADEA